VLATDSRLDQLRRLRRAVCVRRDPAEQSWGVDEEEREAKGDGDMSDVGDELWAWQVQEQPDVWSLVGGMICDPTTGTDMHTPLIHRSRRVVDLMEPIARHHAEKTGLTLRLAHFKIVASA
jgi:hypothetical protein